jgi:RNA 2',3'-cyclic 3'-phosphodiesterase
LSPEPKVETGEAERLRLFIAITVPDEVRAELRKVQGELKTLLPRHPAAWTRPESMHLTLRFLGNVESARVPELSQRLSAVLTGFGELNLICERLGCFPDLRFPRVIWAWVHDIAERLSPLQRRIEEAVSEFAGKPAEAGFVGHVTLARPKQIKRPGAERLARFIEGTVNRRFGQWSASDVSLIQSKLSQAGVNYTEVCRVKLS